MVFGTGNIWACHVHRGCTDKSQLLVHKIRKALTHIHGISSTSSEQGCLNSTVAGMSSSAMLAGSLTTSTSTSMSASASAATDATSASMSASAPTETEGSMIDQHWWQAWPQWQEAPSKVKHQKGVAPQTSKAQSTSSVGPLTGKGTALVELPPEGTSDYSGDNGEDNKWSPSPSSWHCTISALTESEAARYQVTGETRW